MRPLPDHLRASHLKRYRDVPLGFEKLGEDDGCMVTKPMAVTTLIHRNQRSLQLPKDHEEAVHFTFVVSRMAV
jgi:hypothetical protein